MTLFQSSATLKILILWAGAKRNAWALDIRDGLRTKVPVGYDIRVITEDYDDPCYDERSEHAINEADCVLMIAAELDWKEFDSARREYQYFNTLTRARKKVGVKKRNQFRFVRVQGEEPPVYASSGDQPLSFSNPKDVTTDEINTALEYFRAVKRIIDTAGDPPPRIELSTATLSKPGGLLVGTLWIATFDYRVFQLTPTDGSQASSRSLVGALRHLKALHSVHSGLGAMIKEPIAALKQDLPSGICDITRLRREIVNSLDPYRSPHNSNSLDLNDALTDCIEVGLLPTLRQLEQRLSALGVHNRELEFVEAAIERLCAILDHRNELTPDTERCDGHWWVQHYELCRDLVQTRFEVLASDVDISSLVYVQPTSSIEERQFSEALKVAKNLLTATVQWTFSVLVVFSFLHVHRPAMVEDLVPNKIEDALEQLISDWRYNGPTDAVVKRSNEMILCLLAAVADVGGAQSAAA